MNLGWHVRTTASNRAWTRKVRKGICSNGCSYHRARRVPARSAPRPRSVGRADVPSQRGHPLPLLARRLRQALRPQRLQPDRVPAACRRVNYVLVRRDRQRPREALHDRPRQPRALHRSISPSIRQRGAQLGANEVHVHMLADRRRARKLVDFDLRAGQVEADFARSRRQPRPLSARPCIRPHQPTSHVVARGQHRAVAETGRASSALQPRGPRRLPADTPHHRRRARPGVPIARRRGPHTCRSASAAAPARARGCRARADAQRADQIVDVGAGDARGAADQPRLRASGSCPA